jgi:hypothetical protein
VRPFPIPHLQDWRKMKVCLINFNKGKDDEEHLKFCNSAHALPLPRDIFGHVPFFNITDGDGVVSGEI